MIYFQIKTETMSIFIYVRTQSLSEMCDGDALPFLFLNFVAEFLLLEEDLQLVNARQERPFEHDFFIFDPVDEYMHSIHEANSIYKGVDLFLLNAFGFFVYIKIVWFANAHTHTPMFCYSIDMW